MESGIDARAIGFEIFGVTSDAVRYRCERLIGPPSLPCTGRVCCAILMG
jgi:hypothetical protein